MPEPTAAGATAFRREDGLMPVVSRPTARAAPRLVYVRSFEDDNIWRIETCCSRRDGLLAAGRLLSPPREWRACRSFLRTATAWLFVRIARENRKSGWPILTGPTPVQLTSMAGAPRQATPTGLQTANRSCSTPIRGQWEVYVVPAAGGKPRNLTSHPARTIRSPAFPGTANGFTSTRTERESFGYGRCRHPAGMPSR